MTQETLPTIRYNDGGEDRLLFTLPPTAAPSRESVFVFAMPKAGSVLLENITRRLAAHVGLTYVSIIGEYFNLGIPHKDMPASTADIFLPKGYCYGGFRFFPRSFEMPPLRQSRAILLVRDPRDMLVSNFFSMRDSHPEPGKALETVQLKLKMRDVARSVDIDEYVRKAAEGYRKNLADYRESLSGMSGLKLFRYEDVIYDKRAWIADICDWFGWSVPYWKRWWIARINDKMPKSEESTAHVRQVHPGNFRAKLKPETIEWLNAHFAEEMAWYGYDANGAVSGKDGR
jgi:hypothetical protein